MNRKLGKAKKGKAKVTANLPIGLKPPTTIPTPTQSLHPARAPKRSVLVLILEIVGVLAAIATIVAGTGHALERWQETIATVDFSGDIDQNKPFSIPLVAKNSSTIFSVHMPQMSCSADVEYGDGKTNHVLVRGVQMRSAGAPIDPGKTGNFYCSGMDALTVTDKPGGQTIPIMQASMVVFFDYETWVPWTITRHIETHFVMLRTSDSFRWIKGDWIGTTPGIVWPPDAHPPPQRF